MPKATCPAMPSTLQPGTRRNGSWNGRGVPSRRGADVVPRLRIHASSWRHGTAMEHSWTSCNGSNAAAAKPHRQKCTWLPGTTELSALAGLIPTGLCLSACADDQPATRQHCLKCTLHRRVVYFYKYKQILHRGELLQ